jgi:hypothetical protein
MKRRTTRLAPGKGQKTDPAVLKERRDRFCQEIAIWVGNKKLADAMTSKQLGQLEGIQRHLALSKSLVANSSDGVAMGIEELSTFRVDSLIAINRKLVSKWDKKAQRKGLTEEDLAGLAKMRREPAAWLTAFEALLAVRECRAHQVNMDALCDAQEAILQSDQDKVAWEGQRHTLEMERVDWNSKTKICPNRACQMTLAPSDPTCPGCGHQFTVVKNPRVKILMEEEAADDEAAAE